MPDTGTYSSEQNIPVLMKLTLRGKKEVGIKHVKYLKISGGDKYYGKK